MTAAVEDLAACLSLAPVPEREPAFDDEVMASAQREGERRGRQQILPLEWPLPGGLPATPQPGHLRLLPRPGTTSGTAQDNDDFGPVPTIRGDLPDPGPWAARLLQGIAEILTLDRPLSQLARWAGPEVYEDLRRRVEARRRVGAAGAHAGSARPVLRSLHVSEPADGVAEICAVVHDGTRSLAYAVRLEGLDGRWRATALELA
jgi:hypothetical protein